MEKIYKIIIIVIIFVCSIISYKIMYPILFLDIPRVIYDSKGQIIPHNFGNNLLYFPVHGLNFKNAVEYYLKNNPNMEITGLAGENFGITNGYWVIVNEKCKR